MTSSEDFLNRISDRVTGENHKFTQKQIVFGFLGFSLLTVGLVALPDEIPRVGVVPFITLYLTLGPGLFSLLILRGNVHLSARSLVYSVGLSLILMLGLGLALNLVVRPLGVSQPMARLPATVGMTGLALGLASLMVTVRNDVNLTVSIPRILPSTLILLHLPLLAIVSVTILERTGNNIPILLVLIALGIAPLLITTFVNKSWHALGLWTVALGILYHKVPHHSFSFSGNPAVVFTWEAGFWDPGITGATPQSTELLQLGVLYPVFASLSQIDILTQMKIVNPVLVSVIPIAVFVAARSYIGSKRALLAGALFAFAHPYYIQYPPAGRASLPVVFLALLAVVLTDSTLSSNLKATLSIAFSTGLVVSHYGTSYLFLFAVWGGIGLMISYRIFDYFMFHLSRRKLATDGGWKLHQGQEIEFSDLFKSDFLSVPFVLYYSVLNIGWYLYLDAGQKFHLLPNHIVRAFVTLFIVKNPGTGQTAARLQRNYGSTSIFLSKRVYVLIGLLMVIGLCAIYYRRFISENETVFHDEHLALATIFLGIFGMTILVPSWGGGRPMMITFVFSTVYAVVGAAIVFDGLLGSIIGQVNTHLDRGVLESFDGRGFACIIFILFMLNSGVLAATVFEAGAPSTIPSEEPIDQDFGSTMTDVSAHAWLVDNRGSIKTVYGDSIAHGQSDWLNPQIGYHTEGAYSYGSEKPGKIETILDDGVTSGYIILLRHNLESKELYLGVERGKVSMATIEEELNDGHLVYTNGYSEVYYVEKT